MSCFVSSIVHAHGQHDVRNPVWQRIFALIIYLFFLVMAILVLPLVALGPTYLRNIVPASWGPAISDLIDWLYFPFVGLLLIAAIGGPTLVQLIRNAVSRARPAAASRG